MKSPKVTLDQWRALQAVVDCGGFAQAADRLHRSQSSVSYSVNRLQEQLGIRLLHMEGRKAVLSDEGRILLQRSRQLLADASAIEQQAHHLQQGWEAEIRLGVEAAFPSSILMEALKQFDEVAGDTRINLREFVLSGAEDVLHNDQADVIISSYVPQGFLGEEILRVDFIAVAHPDHPLHQPERPLTIDDLNRETHVVVRDSGEKGIDSGWISDAKRWEVASLESSREIIRNGLGFGWLPAQEIAPLIARGQLKPLPLKEGAINRGSLYLLFGNDQVGPASRQLADIIKALCTKEGTL